MKTNERLEKLPESVQEEVKETLKAFTGCYVEQNEEIEEYAKEVWAGCDMSAW